MAKLGEIFDLQMGKTPSRNKSNYWTDGQYSWVSIADLGTYQKYVGATKEEISEVAVRESGIKSVPANTVIMSFKLSLGKTAITKEEVYTNEAIMAFIPTGKYDVLPDYFYHLFTGKDWSKETNRAVMGATLNKAMLSEISVPVPLIDEQRKIAAVLDKVSDLIAKRRQQLDKLDELIKARFVEIFGDPIENNRGWPTKTLDSVCKSIVDCPHSTPSYTSVNTGYMCIRTSTVKKNCILWDKIEYIPEQEYIQRIQRKKPEKGDIVYTREGAILGIAAMIDRDCNVALGQRSMLLSPDTTKCSPQFLSSAMNFDSFLRKALRGVSGSASPHINVGDIKAFSIIIPPLHLQQQFSDFVMRTEKTKTTISESLEKLETLKKALMQEYFG